VSKGAGDAGGGDDMHDVVDEVGVEVGDDHVATVEIRRPPNNFFDAALIGRLADVLDQLAAEDDVTRAVVLCSEGRHFCAGANFGAGGRGERDAVTLYEQAVRIFRQPLPVVAAVQGAAVGGGLGLALAADFRVAAPEARFSANFALLGFHQGFGISVTLPRVVGQQAALALLTTGRRVSGEEAQRLGLADRVVPAGELRPRAHALAAEIAASAPLAVRSIRATLRAGLADEVAAAVQHERAEQERLMRTSDFREGLAAVSERRPGRFTGH
jgi:2-(1,2-epoxy-1,2-dihydrophenyl)acetyl-CoA isomerase